MVSQRVYGTGHDTPVQDAGTYSESLTGQVYDPPRWCDPSTGRFTGQGPVVNETLRPEDYADDDPVNVSDTTGMMPYCNCGGWLPIKGLSWCKRLGWVQAYIAPAGGGGAQGQE
jgi:RHS repeat-associated protein